MGGQAAPLNISKAQKAQVMQGASHARFGESCKAQVMHATLCRTHCCLISLVPANLLAPLLKPEHQPKLGALGVTPVKYEELDKALVSMCWAEVKTAIPAGITHVDPAGLVWDPAEGRHPTLAITGMGQVCIISYKYHLMCASTHSATA